MTRYHAFWITPQGSARIFPRSRKVHTFPTVKAAATALEHKTRRHPTDTRGEIYNNLGQMVFTIAL